MGDVIPEELATEDNDEAACASASNPNTTLDQVFTKTFLCSLNYYKFEISNFAEIGH